MAHIPYSKVLKGRGERGRKERRREREEGEEEGEKEKGLVLTFCINSGRHMLYFFRFPAPSGRRCGASNAGNHLWCCHGGIKGKKKGKGREIGREEGES